DQTGTLTAALPIASLDDWVRARERLAGVAAIRKITLIALSRQEATIEIGYAGSIDQLKTSLAAISLDLGRGEPLWRLAPTGPDRLPYPRQAPAASLMVPEITPGPELSARAIVRQTGPIRLDLNLPNLITLARLLSVPVAVWLILDERYAASFWLFVA